MLAKYGQRDGFGRQPRRQAQQQQRHRIVGGETIERHSPRCGDRAIPPVRLGSVAQHTTSLGS